MMNTKHLAEYIIENSHEDADAKIAAQAYLDALEERKELIKLSRAYLVLLDEMEGKVLVPDEDFDYSTLRRKK